MGTTIIKCQCGAVYEREEHKLTVRDRDSFNCNLCGHEIESWSSSRFPTFRLIKRPDGSEAGKAKS
jgi:hypothetical protein